MNLLTCSTMDWSSSPANMLQSSILCPLEYWTLSNLSGYGLRYTGLGTPPPKPISCITKPTVCSKIHGSLSGSCTWLIWPNCPLGGEGGLAPNSLGYCGIYDWFPGMGTGIVLMFIEFTTPVGRATLPPNGLTISVLSGYVPPPITSIPDIRGFRIVIPMPLPLILSGMRLEGLAIRDLLTLGVTVATS